MSLTSDLTYLHVSKQFVQTAPHNELRAKACVTISSESQLNKGVTTHHSQLISAFINRYKSGQH